MGSPLATSEGGIDVLTNVRKPNQFTEKWKTGSIDVRHFEEVLARELSIEILSHPTSFIFKFVRAQIAYLDRGKPDPIEWLPAENKRPLGRIAIPRCFTRPVRCYFRDFSRVYTSRASVEARAGKHSKNRETNKVRLMRERRVL